MSGVTHRTSEPRPSGFIATSCCMVIASIASFVILRVFGWISSENLFFRAFIPGWWLMFTFSAVQWLRDGLKVSTTRMISIVLTYLIVSATVAAVLILAFSL